MPNTPKKTGEMSHADLKALDVTLSTASYINGGFVPTSDDFDTFLRVKFSSINGKYKEFSNVIRWYKHIQTFSDEERKASPQTQKKKASPKAAPKKKPDAPKAEADAEEDEDDFDLFGEETAEEKAAKEAISKVDYSKAKAQKVVVGKSSLVFDVVPNESEGPCDYEALFKALSAIEMEGVEWGLNYKVVPMCYGLQKIQMVATILDEVETELLLEKMLVVNCDEEKAKRRIELIQLGEDEDDDEEYYVNSCEIISFQKL